MVSTPVELPDNLPACHAIILRQAEAIEQLEARIEQLNRDLASLKRQLFGSRRERFKPGHGEDRGRSRHRRGGLRDGSRHGPGTRHGRQADRE